MKDRLPEEDEIFEAARRLSDPGQRSAYLAKIFAANPALSKRIELLLSAESQADLFFKQGSDAVNQSMFLFPVAEAPGDRIGRYKLLEKIGEGGCGIVYMAEQEQPVRRRVALKIIKLWMD